MSTALGDRMMADAAAYAPLNTLLGTNPFRWYYRELQQGSAFPAIAATQISQNESYSVTRRLATSWSRWQFLIWGGQYAAGVAACNAVREALAKFFDQWSGGIGITGLSQYPNLLVGDLESKYVQTDTPIYQRIVDFSIFSDSTL
jgi:hypothetical protein